MGSQQRHRCARSQAGSRWSRGFEEKVSCDWRLLEGARAPLRSDARGTEIQAWTVKGQGSNTLGKPGVWP